MRSRDDNSSLVAGDMYSTCSDGGGQNLQNNQNCRVFPYCNGTGSAVFDDGRGWGWENSQSCRVRNYGAPLATLPASGGVQQYETTYYPFRGEHYAKTVCGKGEDHGGMYFAVTEKSPLWSGVCNNESWTICQDTDCLGKWDRIPDDGKKWENGQRMVREPSCDLPCGRRYKISSADRRFETTAVIYDACPSRHWNNRFKEVAEGRNPCTEGALHVDLRKPLYLYLNGGQENGNIKVIIDSNPVP
jgi:hypothetical protein